MSKHADEGEFEHARRHSDGTKHDISIDWDDAPDGRDGGYDRHGNYIAPAAMMEIVRLRVHIERLEEALKECADELAEWIDQGYHQRDDYPHIMRRYKREMDRVYRARAALSTSAEGEGE